MLSRVIGALHRWAESGWSGTATATWEVLQGSVFPGPSGAVFAPLAVSDPPRAPRLALWGTLGSIFGGCIAYVIGVTAFDGFGHTVLTMLGVSPATLASSDAMFERHGWLLVFTSTKIVCIAAGGFGLPFATFLPALVVGRAIRFAALTVILRFAGERLARRLARRG